MVPVDKAEYKVYWHISSQEIMLNSLEILTRVLKNFAWGPLNDTNEFTML